MNRSLYKRAFTLNNPPDYNCPICNIGLLRISKDTFKSHTTFDIEEAQDHPGFDPSWIEYIFNCIFQCNNDKCNSKVACMGTGFVDWDMIFDEDGVPEQIWGDYFKPSFFCPNLKIINIPKPIPEEVLNLLNKSFELFFSSPSSSVNLVRATIEEILTDQKVQRYIVNKNKKRVKLSLHNRIDKLPEKYKDLKDSILAVKWLGNAGSHSKDSLNLDLDDAMDAYELIEEILSKIYGSKNSDLAKIAKSVNKSKGSRK